MALRCTVFGHKWGEAGVERQREEDGNEVVVTVRDVRTCRRCGAEDVLSESMEVTAIGPNDAEPASPSAESPASDLAREDEETYDAGTDDGVILDDDEDAGERAPREWPGRPERDDQTDEDGEPAPWPESAREDDEKNRGERFVGADERSSGGDSDDPASRGPSSGNRDADRDGEDDRTAEAGGADPDDPDRRRSRGDDPARGPDDRGTDDPAAEPTETGAGDDPPAMGPDATQRPDDDAEVLETGDQSPSTADEPADPAGRSHDGSADRNSDDSTERNPDDPARDPGQAEHGHDLRGESSGGSERLDPEEPTDDEEPSPEDVVYYCPECGYVDDSKWPSRRAGDICPDCRRSYLAEREQ